MLWVVRNLLQLDSLVSEVRIGGRGCWEWKEKKLRKKKKTQAGYLGLFLFL